MKSNNKNALIILGKFPKPGNVKTRLGEKIGHDQAVKIYQQSIENIFAEIAKIQDQITPFFYYGNLADKVSIQNWIGEKLTIIDPKSENIEKHLLTAFQDRFKNGAEKVISIATDIPKLTSAIILAAFKALDDHDVVIGPDHKNGFYLFGTKKMYPQLFQYQYQNSQNIVNEEIDRVKKMGLKVHVLPTLIDVDTEEDLSLLLAAHKPT